MHQMQNSPFIKRKWFEIDNLKNMGFHVRIIIKIHLIEMNRHLVEIVKKYI